MLDLEQASKFLSALTAADKGDTKFSFQTFDDVKDRDDKKLAKIRFGSLSEYQDFLVHMNERKAGVFVAVNRISGKRSNANVQELRAAFIDCDDVDVSFDDVEQKPNIIVQSARGIHAYWLLRRGESLDRFKAIQIALANKFGTDAQVNDLARVMRLPGFAHCKKDPSLLVKVEHVDTERIYTIDELFEGMQLEEVKLKALPSPKPTYINRDAQSRRDVTLDDKVKRADKFLAGIPAAIEGSGGHATTLQACRVAHDFDLPDSTFWPMLLRWNQSCVPPWKEEELRYQYEHAASKYPRGNKLDVELPQSFWTPNAADVRVPDDVPWSGMEGGVSTQFDQVNRPKIGEPPDIGWHEESEGGKPVGKGRDDKKGKVKKRTKKDRKKRMEGDGRVGAPPSEILSSSPPRYGDLDRDPLEASHAICREYHLAHEDNGQWYVYDNTKWMATSKHTIEKMLMQYTTPDEFCNTYLSESVTRVKAKSHLRKIDWNQVGDTEIPLIDGVLDFMTGEVRPHNPDDYLERIVPYQYDPDAECPVWHRCLEDWLPGKDEEKLAIQLFLGYCLMPHAKYKKALMLWGKPHTGKSQICMVATELVGGTDFTCGILPSKMNDPRACAPIKGAALNVIPDLPKDQLIGDGGFKQMVSAGDTIQIDQKHLAPEQYTPTAKHIYATNNLPSINDPSAGVFERLLIIQFNDVVPEEARDPLLDAKIKKEIEGILAWAVKGARMLYEDNGRWPRVKSSVDAIEKYKLDENPVYDFIEESGRIMKDESGRISIERFTEMFNDYHSGKTWTKKAVRSRLEYLGYTDCRMMVGVGRSKTKKRAIRGIVEVGEHLTLLDGLETSETEPADEPSGE